MLWSKTGKTQKAGVFCSVG